MTGRSSASQLRLQIVALKAKRQRLEHTLLRRGRMLDACLIERRGLAGGKQRKTPAYYLSRKVEGKTKLTYVRKREIEGVRAAADAWRAFSRAVARWVKVNQDMEALIRRLGRVQIVDMIGRRSDGR